MVTKARIVGKTNDNKLSVFIPTIDDYNSSNNPNEEDYITNATASISVVPGCDPHYNDGDTVLVCIEDNDLSKVIIMGRLITAEDKGSVTDFTLSDLTVNDTAKLPEDTSIGPEVTKENIKCLAKVKSNIQGQFDLNLAQKIDVLKFLTDALDKTEFK